MRRRNTAAVMCVWLMVGLCSAPSGSAATASAKEAPRLSDIVLGIDGTAFTLNGKKTFLLGASYYGALGAPDDFIARDLDDLKTLGFNWIRVFAVWDAFDNNVSAVDATGKAREPHLSKLKAIVAAAEKRGMVVDVTLARMPCLPNQEAHLRAAGTLADALQGCRNVYFDLANERDQNYAGGTFVSYAELRALRDRVKRADPDRLVTASGEPANRADLARYLVEAGLDFISPHLNRDAGTEQRTAEATRKFLGWMKELGRAAPIHYQEPFRRDYLDYRGFWQPEVETFCTDLRNAQLGGAAGWCFHNGSPSPPERFPAGKRRSFDMRPPQGRLMDQLDAVERQFLKRAALCVQESPPPAAAAPKKMTVHGQMTVHGRAPVGAFGVDTLEHVEGAARLGMTLIYSYSPDSARRQLDLNDPDADNVIYEIANEPFNNITDAKAVDQWHKHIAAVIINQEKALDVSHLVAANEVIHDNPQVSILNWHYVANLPKLDLEYALGKPISLDETNGSLIHASVDDVRVEAWEWICGGGACYNNLSWDFTPEDPTGKAGAAVRGQLKVLRDFVSTMNFVGMKPVRGIISGLPADGVHGRALAEPGKAYWIYLHHSRHKTYGSFITGYEARKGRHRDSLELAVPPGTYRVRWVRPRDGRLLREDKVKHDGKKLRLASPDYDDADITAVLRAHGEDEGVVADYRFDEGQGTTLHDRSGNGNHGTIHGASWVRCGDVFALKFERPEDSVDCGAGPSLNLAKAGAMEAWVYPETTPGGGEASILGKSFGSYLLTHYVTGRLHWYAGGGPNQTNAPLATKRWSHVVATHDGQTLNLYFDGLLVGSRVLTRAAESGGAFRMGAPAVDSEYSRGARFQGMLTAVRVYNRALSAEEVVRQYRTTFLTREIALHPRLSLYSGSLMVDLDVRGLGESRPVAAVQAELVAAGTPGPLATRRVALSPPSLTAEVTLKLGSPAPGEYALRAVAIDAGGKPLGKPTTTPIHWPERPRWETAPHARVLNNFVTELLDVAPAAGAAAPLEFVNPRNGWVFFSLTARAVAAAPEQATLDGRPLEFQVHAGRWESMQRLSKGPHQLQMGAHAGMERIAVRAIPELLYAGFGANPHVHEYGEYDWAFLSKHVLPNVNVLVGGGGQDDVARSNDGNSSSEKPVGPNRRDRGSPMDPWRRQGRRIMLECLVPGLTTDRKVPTAEETERYWSTHPGMTDPRYDGVFVDEFWNESEALFRPWTEAVRRMAGNERLKGRQFYPYCAPLHNVKPSREFIQAVMDAGWRFGFERYLSERQNPGLMRAYLDTMLRQPIGEWRAAMPGAERHMIVTLGVFSQPPESLDVNPSVNLKVFLDMQLNLLANAPECFGLGGVMTYLSSYTDEETVRWMGRLFRHYCIDGRGEMLSTDPLMLRHIENPDFEKGSAGWTVAEAEPGSIAAKRSPGFSWLEGRFPRTDQGDTVLWMKRSVRGPNSVSQAIKGLQPGRLYSLRMYSGDAKDLAVRQKHAVAVALHNVEVLAEKSFQHVFANCYDHSYGPYNRDHRAWMNYHWIIFRAKGEQATLRISDWATPKEPGGPLGQELITNFVEIQPYEEFNEVYRVCTDTGDAGAFYIGRDWSQRGNVIRYNDFHDLAAGLDGEEGFNGVMAVYLDDQASGMTVFGNVFSRVHCAVMMGGGRDNTVENNLFAFCGRAIHLDARGVGDNYSAGNTLFDRLKPVQHDRAPYRQRYPGLAGILGDDPGHPKGNVISRNVCVGGPWDVFYLSSENQFVRNLVKMEDNLTEGDPGLVAPDKGDFRLKKDAPARKLGFKPIPFDKIGPYRDEYRESR